MIQGDVVVMPCDLSLLGVPVRLIVGDVELEELVLRLMPDGSYAVEPLQDFVLWDEAPFAVAVTRSRPEAVAA